MLHVAERYDGEPRLYLRHPSLSAEAWIERAHSPALYPHTDWTLWYRRAPHEPLRMHKSQLRLELESVLRAWLLRRYGRRLYALTFRELCDLARRTRPTRPPLRRSLPR